MQVWRHKNVIVWLGVRRYRACSAITLQTGYTVLAWWVLQLEEGRLRNHGQKRVRSAALNTTEVWALALLV